MTVGSHGGPPYEPLGLGNYVGRLSARRASRCRRASSQERNLCTPGEERQAASCTARSLRPQARRKFSGSSGGRCGSPACPRPSGISARPSPLLGKAEGISQLLGIEAVLRTDRVLL